MQDLWRPSMNLTVRLVTKRRSSWLFRWLLLVSVFVWRNFSGLFMWSCMWPSLLSIVVKLRFLFGTSAVPADNSRRAKIEDFAKTMSESGGKPLTYGGDSQVVNFSAMLQVVLGLISHIDRRRPLVRLLVQQDGRLGAVGAELLLLRALPGPRRDEAASTPQRPRKPSVFSAYLMLCMTRMCSWLFRRPLMVSVFLWRNFSVLFRWPCRWPSLLSIVL